jgi:hypothetical protein
VDRRDLIGSNHPISARRVHQQPMEDILPLGRQHPPNPPDDDPVAIEHLRSPTNRQVGHLRAVIVH